MMRTVASYLTSSAITDDSNISTVCSASLRLPVLAKFDQIPEQWPKSMPPWCPDSGWSRRRLSCRVSRPEFISWLNFIFFRNVRTGATLAVDPQLFKFFRHIHRRLTGHHVFAIATSPGLQPVRAFIAGLFELAVRGRRIWAVQAVPQLRVWPGPPPALCGYPISS